jgi:hypothetical protein
MPENNTADKKPWSRSLIAGVTVVTTVVAGIAAFSGNVMSIRDNFGKLFQSEPVKITVREATATEGGFKIMFIDFVVRREGRADVTPVCRGEGIADDGRHYFSLQDHSIPVGMGDEAMSSEVGSAIGDDRTPNTLNFRLDCGVFGFTPWIPAKVKINPNR